MSGRVVSDIQNIEPKARGSNYFRYNMDANIVQYL